MRALRRLRLFEHLRAKDNAHTHSPSGVAGLRPAASTGSSQQWPQVSPPFQFLAQRGFASGLPSCHRPAAVRRPVRLRGRRLLGPGRFAGRHSGPDDAGRGRPPGADRGGRTRSEPDVRGGRPDRRVLRRHRPCRAGEPRGGRPIFRPRHLCRRPAARPGSSPVDPSGGGTRVGAGRADARCRRTTGAGFGPNRRKAS